MAFETNFKTTAGTTILEKNVDVVKDIQIPNEVEIEFR